MEPLKGAVSLRYTVVLVCYGFFSLLVAAALKWSALDRVHDPNIHFVLYLHLIFGVAALLVALLRWTKGVQSLPASTGLSIALAAALPLGTVIFLYWLFRVRPAERSFPMEPKPVRWYTAAIVLGALVCALSSVLFAGPVAALYDLGELTPVLGKAYGVLAVALALVGGLRCFKRRWGFYATFILNVVLVILLPFGTVAAIVWFIVVQRYDNESFVKVAAEGAA